MGLRCLRTPKSHGWKSADASLNASSWTLAGNVRIESAPAVGDQYPFAAQAGLDATSLGPYWFGYWNTGGTLQLRAGYVTAAGAITTAVATATLTVGRWYAVAAVHDDAAGTITFYWGERQSPVTHTAISVYSDTSTTAGLAGTPATGVKIFRLGADGDASLVTASVCNASLSEWAGYNVALSRATLESRLSERLNGYESGLIWYYPCDDGPVGEPTALAYDCTNAIYPHLTLVNRPAWTDDPLDLYYRRGSWAQTSLLGLQSWTMLPDVVITASSEHASFPDDNLRNPRQAKPWAAVNGVSPANVVFNFGRARPILLFTVDNHTLSGAATVTVQLHTADSWGSPQVSESVTWRRRKLRHVFTRPYEYQYARVLITDPDPYAAAHALGGIQLGTAHWWAHYDPVDILDLEGASAAIEDPSVAVLTPHARRIPRVLDKERRRTFGLSQMRAGRALHLREQLRAAGEGGPVYVCPDIRRDLYVRDIYGLIEAFPTETLHDATGTRRDFQGLTVREDHA